MDLDQPKPILDSRYVAYINVPIAGLFLLLSFLFLYVYRGTCFYLLNDWTQWQSGPYAHGFIVLAISAVMIWGMREKLKKIAIRPNYWAILLVLFFSLTWMFGILLGIRIAESLSFFLLFPSLIFALTGRHFVVQLWFPLIFILVAFPVWELFLPILQSIATTISHFFLKLSGTVVLRENTYLIIPAGKFLVAEGCSGLRYLLAAMTFGGFYIYLERLTQWRAVTFFSIVIFAAILANGLRITAVVIAGNLTAMQHPWVHEHLTLGWYIFAAMLVPVFWLGNKFSDAEQGVKKKVIIWRDGLVYEKPITYTILLPILIMALLAGPLLKTALLSRASSSISDIELSLPRAEGEWELSSGSHNIQQLIQPNYEGVDRILDQVYSDGNSRVRLYIASYLQQSQDKELINVNNYLYDEKYWQSEPHQLLSPEGPGFKLVEVQMKNNTHHEKLIWYWYRSAGYSTNRPVITKLLDLYGLITMQKGSSVIMISVDITDGRENSRASLNSFYSSMNIPINKTLDAMNSQ